MTLGINQPVLQESPVFLLRGLWQPVVHTAYSH